MTSTVSKKLHYTHGERQTKSNEEEDETWVCMADITWPEVWPLLHYLGNVRLSDWMDFHDVAISPVQ